MKKRINRHINGIKHYYQRDGLSGVWYYINHRIYNRVIKPLKHADFLIPFSPERQLAKRYEALFETVNDTDFLPMGNYCLFQPNAFHAESTVYSLGVLSDTTFDQAIVDSYGCNIHLFDPSNIALAHINKVNNSKFVFSQIGIWKETCDVEFTTPKYGGSPSMILGWSGKRFTHRCVDIKEVMQQNGHQHIDLIKLDIEGAAFGVLNRMLDIEVHPSQIIAEFERPRSDNIKDYFGFYSDLITLNSRLSTLGYKAYCIPRKKFKYFSIEFIYVRQNA